MEDYLENDNNNPLLRPIHGVSLADYAAAMYFRTAGVSMDQILEILNISPTIWNEVDMLWNKRMEEDAALMVITFFSRYYNDAQHNERFISINSLMSNF